MSCKSRARTGRDPPDVPCLAFQRAAELGEARRQGPVAEYRRVIQRPGLALEGRQVVERVEHHRVPLVRTRVRRDDRPARPPRRPGRRSPSRRPSRRRKPPGDAVAVRVQRRVEPSGTCPRRPRGGSRRRRSDPAAAPLRRGGAGAVLREPIPDQERPRERLHDALAFQQATLTQEGVQFLEIGDARQGRGEPPLHRL